ncbi:MAG: hypothetical protein JSS91_04475 [Bacteroidetes bacterium]|nr:hypothetical protein [Bacteroidota bacterium]
MKTNNKINLTKQEILENLPDFAAGNISDRDISDSVMKALESDPELKREYEEILISMNFLEKSELSEPPVNYFNNLSVRINERIGENTPYERSPSFIPGLNKFFRILIPSLAVLLIALYFIFRQNEPVNQLTGNDSSNINKSVIVAENTTDGTKDSAMINKELITQPDVIISKEGNVHKKNNSRKTANEKKVIRTDIAEIKKGNEDNNSDLSDSAVNNIPSGYADIFDLEINEETDPVEENEIIDADENSEIDLQEEFRQLSPQDQQEIISILKDSKI